MPLAAGGEVRALNALLSGVYVSLHTGNPSTTGANEVDRTTTSYERQAATFTNTGSNPTTAANDAAIQFPQAEESWGTITHFGIWSAATGGTFLGGEAVNSSRAVATGDIVRWEIDALTITAD